MRISTTLLYHHVKYILSDVDSKRPGGAAHLPEIYQHLPENLHTIFLWQLLASCLFISYIELHFRSCLCNTPSTPKVCIKNNTSILFFWLQCVLHWTVEALPGIRCIPRNLFFVYIDPWYLSQSENKTTVMVTVKTVSVKSLFGKSLSGTVSYPDCPGKARSAPLESVGTAILMS